MSHRRRIITASAASLLLPPVAQARELETVLGLGISAGQSIYAGLRLALWRRSPQGIMTGGTTAEWCCDEVTNSPSVADANALSAFVGVSYRF